MSRTYKGAVRTSGYLKSPATVGGIHVSSSSSLMSAKFLKENDGRTVTNIEEMMQRVAGLTCKVHSHSKLILCRPFQFSGTTQASESLQSEMVTFCRITVLLQMNPVK